MAFTKERTSADQLRGVLVEKIKKCWGVDFEKVYPAVIVRTGLGASLEVTPLLRHDENGSVVMLGSDEESFLKIFDGDLYRNDEIETDNFRFEFESTLIRVLKREYSDSALREDRTKIQAVFPGAKISYLFDSIPGEMGLGLPSKVFILTFPHHAWMNVDAMLVAYSFLVHPEAMAGVVSSGGAVYNC